MAARQLTRDAQRHMIQAEVPTQLCIWRQRKRRSLLLSSRSQIHKGHIVPPGVYHLDLAVSARNAKTLHATLSIAVDGRWFNDPGEMLAGGIHIHVVHQSA